MPAGTVVALPVVVLACALMAVWLSACGVAPVKSEASPPQRHLFAGAHGQPLAYGGRVCTLDSAHTHSYPPVPRAAFLDCPEGARETRPLYAYFGEHPEHAADGQRAGRCFREGFHLHLELPGPGLRFDERHGAYVEGEKGSARCDVEACVYKPGATACHD